MSDAAASGGRPGRPAAGAVRDARDDGPGRSWQARDGAPYPLGVSYLADEDALNFALYSKHAERLRLLVYGAEDLVSPLRTIEFDLLRNRSGRIWHCRVPADDLRAGRYYAYSADGPGDLCAPHWHAFDPDKILLDPYAPEVYFPPDFDRDAACTRGSNAGRAALGVLRPRRPEAVAMPHRRRIRHFSDLVIYELHVGGFTRHPSSPVAEHLRGTFAGVLEMLPYLVDLGITAVELMPVFQFDSASGDYWGYSPISFFAPHAGYATPGSSEGVAAEFRRMIDGLHASGIEVLLDVVYNHTAEGDHLGPTYSFRGLDNSTFYLCSSNPARPYLNYAGTGNTLHCANRHVRRMILDSLRHWAVDMGVDGFRFDLASIFARDADGGIAMGDDGAPIFGEMGADPDLAASRLIAEPWDAVGTYQLGRHFPGIEWQQWNGRFRDDVRRFVRGDRGLVPAMMYRLYGSDDLFPDSPPDVFHPYQSVNYVTSHDGFTLYDLVAYDRKHNAANGHGDADGADENFSANYGHEGHSGTPPGVLALRQRQVRNFIAILLLANGTPMLRAGDEFLQSQQGNNNPYNQNNETTWLDWRLRGKHADVHRFVRMMIALRRNHPSLCRGHFWREDIRWFGARGRIDMSFDSQALAYCLQGRSEDDGDLYVMINMSSRVVDMQVQDGEPGAWRRVVDTALSSPEDIVDDALAAPLPSATYPVAGRSVVVLLRDRAEESA